MSRRPKPHRATARANRWVDETDYVPWVVYKNADIRLDAMEDTQRRNLANPSWRPKIRYRHETHEQPEPQVLPITTRNLILGPDGRPLEMPKQS